MKTTVESEECRDDDDLSVDAFHAVRPLVKVQCCNIIHEVVGTFNLKDESTKHFLKVHGTFIEYFLVSMLIFIGTSVGTTLRTTKRPNAKSSNRASECV